MKASSGRDIRFYAFEVLKEYDKAPHFSQDHLQKKLDLLSVDRKDKHLARNLVFGVIKAKGTLDHIIRHFSEIPLKRIRKDILLLLRIGLYQILFLQRVPDYASVHTTVSLVKKIASGKIAAFANAILRNIIRSLEGRGDLEAPPSPSVCYGPSFSVRFSENIFASPDAKAAEYLSKAYSYPLWLVRKWLHDYSLDDVLSILRAGNTVRPIFFWINKARAESVSLLEALRKKGVAVEETGAEGLYRSEASNLPLLREYLDSGGIYIQDKTPYDICNDVFNYLGKWNLDICAGPGGKALALSALSAKARRLLAVEPDEKRFALLRENVHKMGQTEIVTLRADAFSLPDDYKESFDFVIADVPCSNSGVLARRPEARWRLSRASLKSICDRQKRLASKALGCLKGSGYFVYSTCSIEKEENSEIVLYLGRHFSDISLIREKLFLPKPGPQNGDGGYAAILEKGS